MAEIGHTLTAEMVCPWCGDEQGDSWDHNLSDGESCEIDCDECGKEYKAVFTVTVDYSTEKINQ